MRIRSLLLLSTAATVGFAALVYGNSTPSEAAPPAKPAPAVKTGDRKPPGPPAAEVLVVTGTVVPDQRTDVSSDIGGRIEAVLVEPGQRVEQGQAVVRVTRPGTRTKADPKPEPKLEIIRAPFAGVVTATFVSAGEWAAHGNRLVTIVDDDPLIAKLAVPAASAAKVALEQPVELIAAGNADHPIRAAITAVGTEVDARSRTLTIEVALPKGTGLSPGTYVEGRITVGAGARVSVNAPPAPPARR